MRPIVIAIFCEAGFWLLLVAGGRKRKVGIFFLQCGAASLDHFTEDFSCNVTEGYGLAISFTT